MSYQPGVYRKPGGNELVVASGGTLTAESSGVVALDSGAIVTGVNRNIRRRFTIAEINAGATLLSAVSGYRYRMLSCSAISVGGAAGAVTTVDVLGTQSTATVKLVAYAQASLTQSTVLRDGASGGTVLADGASYATCDANTAITVGKTGSSVTTATHIDINFSYVIEAA